MQRWRRLGVRFLSLALGFALCVSVALPWFSLPLLGWNVPTPAWNALGLGLLVLGNLQILRAVGLPGVAWGIRLVLPWALYRWWGAEELFRQWGRKTLLPMQASLSDVNRVLTTLGANDVTLFAPEMWRDIEPGLGWKVAGVGLMLSVVVTLLDQPSRSRCPSCQARVGPDDPFCHGCGHRFPDVPGCAGCGRVPSPGDKFCRSCGRRDSLESGDP